MAFLSKVELRVLYGTLFILITMLLTSAENYAGIKTIVTQKGLDAVNAAVVDVVTSEMNAKKIEDHSGDNNGLYYSFSNINIQSLEGVTSSVTPTTNLAVTWSLSLSKVVVVSSWSIKYKESILGNEITILSDSGTLRADVHRTSVSLKINILVTDEHLDISLQSCNSNVGDIDLDFSGSIASDLYEAVANAFDNELEKNLEKAICIAVNTALENMSADMMHISTNVATTILDLPISLDYSIIDVESGVDYLSFFHKGQFKWQGEIARFITDDRAFPSSAGQSYMLIVSIRETVINSLLNITTMNNLLDGQLNTKNIGLTNIIDLNLSCPSLAQFCIGDILPEAAKQYPNSTVYIRGEINKAFLSITAADFVGSVIGRIYFQADNGSDDLMLFSAALELDLSMQIGISGNELALRVTDVKGSLVVDHSNIGKVITESVEVITVIGKTLILNAFKENMNKWTTNFPISLPRHTTVIDAGITLSDGFITIGVDFCYKRTCQNDASSIDWIPMVLDTAYSDFQIYDILATTTTTTTTTSTSTTTAAPKQDSIGMISKGIHVHVSSMERQLMSIMIAGIVYTCL